MMIYVLHTVEWNSSVSEIWDKSRHCNGNAARKDTGAPSNAILFLDFVEGSGPSTRRRPLIRRRLCLCRMKTNDVQTVPDGAAPAPDTITHIAHPHRRHSGSEKLNFMYKLPGRGREGERRGREMKASCQRWGGQTKVVIS